MRKAETIAVFLIDQGQVSTLFDDASFADDADRDIAAAVERVDRVDERGGQLVVDADRDRQQPASAARFEGVDHPERQHVVAIAADIGVEDEPHWLGGSRQARDDSSHRSADHHDDRQDERLAREAVLRMEMHVARSELASRITPDSSLITRAGSTPVKRWSSP